MGKLKSGAIISYIYLFIESISSIILTPFLVNYLGDSEYGIYGLAATLSSYILLLDLGVGNALVRYFAKYRVNNEPENERKLMGVSIIFYAIASFIAMLVLAVTVILSPYIFAKGLTVHEISRAKLMFWVVGVTAVVTLLESPFKRIIMAYEKFVLSKLISMTKVCLRFTLVILVLIDGGMGVSVLAVNLVLTVLGALFEMWYVFTKLKVIPKFSGIEKPFYREIFSYSSIVVLQMIATQIDAMVGQVSISIFIPAASAFLAIYSVGINLTHYFQSIGGAVNSLLMPSAVKAVERKNDSNQMLNLMVKITRIQLILLGLIYVVFLINGQAFIRLWVGESKELAFVVSAVIMFPQLLFLSQSIGSHLLWALNKHKIQAMLQFAVSIVNICVTVILVNVINPVVGAAIGSAVAMLLGNVVVCAYIYKKEIGISIIAYYRGQFKGILPCLLLTALLGYLFTTFVPLGESWISFIIRCAFAVLVYIVSMLIIGLNKDEKRMIFNKIGK